MAEPRKIWIVGASEGIGAALARAYARTGAKLVLSARGGESLEALCATLGAHPLPLDLARSESVTAAAEALAALGPLDGAINLAALYDPGRVDEISLERAAELVAVNLTGSLLFVRAARPLLRPGGQLVLTASVAGYFGLPQGQIYSATKAGVINLAETLRAEAAGAVDVRLICPGFVATRLTARNDFAMPFVQSPEQAAARILAGLAGRRFEVHFPRRLSWPLKLLRALPYGLALPLSRRLVR